MRMLPPASHDAAARTHVLAPDRPPPAAWLKAFRRRLLAWYRRHARVLPWRESPEPYRVWISEIMLQQTQVATVIPYFERFVAAFPDVPSLAAAPEDQVLRLWEGLGYYRRAKQLHAAAKRIVERHGGEFPRSLAHVLDLPGVGRYTAGAILSIACDERLPIVEANTRRLYARLLAEPGATNAAAVQQRLWNFAEQLLPRRASGSFNQALMELGATVCTPRNPACQACPVAMHCAARAQGLQHEIPRAPAKLTFESVREVAVVVTKADGSVLIRRYQPGERWAGLWDFVRFPLPGQSGDAPDIHHPFALEPEVHRRTGWRVTLAAKPLMRIKHGVTRFRITLDVYEATANEETLSPDRQQQWVNLTALESMPFSTTGRKIARLVAERNAREP